MNVTVLNSRPAKPERCQSHEGCKHEAQKFFYTQWLCNLHFLRAYRDLEMNNESGEAA
jgi:hypothetical protein